MLVIGWRLSRDAITHALIGRLLLRSVRLSSATASLLAFARGTPRKAGDKQKHGPFFFHTFYSFFSLSFLFYHVLLVEFPSSGMRFPLAPLRPGTAPLEMASFFKNDFPATSESQFNPIGSEIQSLFFPPFAFSFILLSRFSPF